MRTSEYYKSSDLITFVTVSQAYAVGGTYSIWTTSTPGPYVYTMTEEYRATYPVPSPRCSLSTSTQCKFSADCDKCTISGGTVRLLYFPTSRTVSGDHNTTTAPATTGLATAVYGNATLTSPSVYISFHTAYAENACGAQVGNRHPGAILSLKPDQLSSAYGLYGTMYSEGLDPLGYSSSTPYLIAASFDLANLNWPVPASAYENQPKFALGGEVFSVIFDDYNPVLAVPPQIRSLDPAWKSCALDWQGLYDPPKALHPASVMAGPVTTAGNDPVVTAAVPSSAPDSPARETNSASIVTHVSSIALATLEPSQMASHVGSASSSSTELRSEAISTTPPLSSHSELVTNGVTTPRTVSVDATQTAASDSAQTIESHMAGTTDSAGQDTSASSLSRLPAAAASGDAYSPTSSLRTSLGTPSVMGAHSRAFVATSSLSAIYTGEGGDTSRFSVGSSSEVDPVATSDPSSPTTELLSDIAASEPTRSGVSARISSGQDPQVIAIGSATITRGATALTVSGVKLSLGTGKVVAGGTTITLPDAQYAPSNSAATDTLMTFVADGRTLSASVVRQEGTIRSSGTTQDPDPSVSAAVFSFGSHVYTVSRVDASEVVVAGDTISAGGSGIAVPAGTLSLGSNDELMLMWTATKQTHTTPGLATTVAEEGAVLALLSSTITAMRPQGASDGVIAVDGVTLTAGGAAFTISRETVSALSDGLIVASDGRRETMSLHALTATTTIAKSTLATSPATSIKVVDHSYATNPAVPTATATSGAERRAALAGATIWRLMLMLTLVLSLFKMLSHGAYPHSTVIVTV
ncbi:hypothetical protein LTR85_007192 [Meristemomyces frigidus]|nr:hypothetical protein LTR85_007192 [Meristemomyces frigidus]